MRIGAISWRKLRPHTKSFGKSPKRSKQRGIFLYLLLRDRTSFSCPRGRGDVDCLADSIESQCFHASFPHNIAHINRIEEEVQNKASLEPKDEASRFSQRSSPVSVEELNIHH
ncbi:hypothetical protein EVAR_84330_1 [Eumeta japonica]|uniref:Uncharacterized protein n=1 Tax=Eumeta variegata TaxID=151549 RepID=A0A4C1U510_EUMVA|nr:hypothetical protein EVAR_84330_1 [Eumeta japonica]